MKYKALVDALGKTYCFYRRKYVTLGKGGQGTIMHGYGDAAIESHLEGRYALAVFAGENVTRFLTVDVDAGGKKAVRMVIDAFVELGIPEDRIYVSMSGKKGYHVDIFFVPWLYNDKAKNLYELMIWKTGLDPRKVEYYPTNSRAIKIPLGVHRDTGKRCWFLDRKTLNPIEDFEYIYQILPVGEEFVRDLLRQWNKKRWNELYAEMITDDTGHDQSVSRDIVFDSDYYESKRILAPGTRHDIMIEIARDLRTYGANQFQIEKALRGFYYRQDRTLIESSEREVLDDIEEIAKWAEESVAVRKPRPSPNEGKVHTVVFTLANAENILSASTSASRRVALLIYAFCKMFHAAHISYDYISKTVGCSVPTVKNAIRDLMRHKLIGKESGGCHYRGGRLVRQSNTYFITADQLSDNGDCYEYASKIDNTTLNDLYYGLLTHFFPIEYLAKHLTKPELERCKEVISANGADDTTNDAGRDENVSCIQ